MSQVLKGFYLFRQEIIICMGTKGRNIDEMKDESLLLELALAVDITKQLNDLNLKLLGKNKLITQL